MADITIFFKDADKTLSGQDVEIREELTRVVITETTGDYTVVPLSSVSHYLVEV